MSDIKSYVGKKYVDDREELVSDNAPDASQSDPQKTVRHSELPENSRVVRPGDFVTMDYKEDRLNLHLDVDDIVVKQKMG